jgi:hypothetical protein
MWKLRGTSRSRCEEKRNLDKKAMHIIACMVAWLLSQLYMGVALLVCGGQTL